MMDTWLFCSVDNLLWIFANGLHSGNSPIQSPNWQHIGNPELIQKRAKHPVPVGPQGYLNDYVPFYFTPFSPMLYQTQQLQYCPLSSRQGFNGIHLFSKVTPSLTGGIYNSFVTLETTI